MNLSPEQMQFLADKGLSLAEVIEFASLTATRSKGADRQARYRERQKAQSSDRDVTSDVTRDASQGDASPLSRPPNEYISNPPTHTPETQTPAHARGDDFPCPDWCEPSVWRDLKRNRKTKKLTNTPTAHRQFVAKIEAMADENWPPGRLVEAITAKGWGGPHDPRDERKSSNVRQFGNSNQRTAELAEAKMQSLG